MESATFLGCLVFITRLPSLLPSIAGDHCTDKTIDKSYCVISAHS